MSSETSATGDSVAEIIGLYKRDVDRSLLRAQLAKSVDACRVVTLEKLIAIKRAAGRPKDLEAIAELEALRDERG